MDRTTAPPYLDDFVVDEGNDPDQLIDATPLLPPPPLSPGDGLGHQHGPHDATASGLGHRMMMPFPGQQHHSPTEHQHGLFPELELTSGTRLAPQTHSQGHQSNDIGQQLLPSFPPGAVNARPDWPIFDPSTSNPPDSFLQPADPFFSNAGTNIVDFGLNRHGEDYETNPGSILTPLPPLSDTSPTFDLNFDFNSPIWQPAPRDTAFIPPSLDDTLREDAAYPRFTDSNDKRPGPSTSVSPTPRHGNPSWLADEDDYDMASSTNQISSHESLGGTIAGRKRSRKGKSHQGSETSGSIASTHETIPFSEPTSNPSNPLPQGGDRRRSTRTKTRAKSVATTTSASSSSTAPTPGSISTTDTPRSSSATAAAAAQQPKLRSASRASKNAVNRPTDTPEERRTRASHNLVEKQYRNRLNAQFEGLLSALPELSTTQSGKASNARTGEPEIISPGGDALASAEGERKVSKAEVLERARQHIETLERETEALRREKEGLMANLLKAQGEMAAASGKRSDGPIEKSPEDTSEGREEVEGGTRATKGPMCDGR